MQIYTHFQTVAILKKNYMAFCFLIYNIYIYIYIYIFIYENINWKGETKME